MKFSSRSLFFLSCLSLGAFLLLYMSPNVIHNDEETTFIHVKDRQVVSETASQMYKERTTYAMSTCYFRRRGQVPWVLTHGRHKLAYCSIPKNGCTFWRRVLLYLYNDTGGVRVKSPFETSRHFVHGVKKKHLKESRQYPPMEKRIRDYTRFVFVRNPYARLWSAYLDKFRLPGFWWNFGLPIVKQRKNITERASECRHDITFEEFLRYVIQEPLVNAHWRPMSYHCDPCIFKPTVIGKVETFNKDAKYILSKIGYEGILSSFNHDEYVEEELMSLTEHTFEFLNSTNKLYKKCLTAESIALLLWEVFQLNGYLPKDVAATDAIKDIKNIDKTSFTNLVIKVYRSGSQEDKHQWKLQKASALKEAFGSIPKAVTDKLVSIYENDFIMFGYDGKPPAPST